MATWKIDPMHSEVQFKVKHLMISTVTGSFGSYDGELNGENEDFSDAKITFSADIDSINTGNEQRDGHLKSPEFFDAAEFPTLNFSSSAFTSTGKDTFDLTGDLNIKGTSKSVTLKAVYGGQMVDFYGNTKAGFEIEGKINRKDFGLTWDAVTEAGGVVVSDEIKLIFNIQLAKI
jgi:polyisoprenoid-binding protein YceI